MAFDVFTDGSANLPKEFLKGISLLPFDYIIDGESRSYEGDLDAFPIHEYYEKLRNGSDVKTSLVNMHSITTYFEPTLQAGRDLVYVAMSSGISGTYNTASIVARSLMEEYPGRTVYVLDAKGCGLGSGLLAIHAAELSSQGLSIQEAIPILEDMVPHCCQYFTVNDLGFLRRTGRVSGVVAELGTLLRINPILYGTKEGIIVVTQKLRGRKKAIASLVETFTKKWAKKISLPIFISHGDCIEDAKALYDRVKAIASNAKIVIAPHEPISGAHVGPGMLGLFFYGDSR